MSKPVILVVFGTRPEVVKLAPVVHALQRRDDLAVRLCVTAQHREMLDGMLSNFELLPNYDLDLMQRNQDLNDFSARALPRLQNVVKLVRPDFVLVQGDTTTAFVTALAAFYEHVPVGHVEAGLRSFDRDNPFPEEINRVLISRLSELHFAPTSVACGNLLGEGVSPRKIALTGNTVVDALRWAAARPHRFQEPALRAAFAALGSGDQAVLVTTHRRENLGKPLESLCRAFLALVQRHPRLHLFYPVHMNPKVQDNVKRLLRHPRAHLLPALGYLDLIQLISRSRFVMTDSGGLQEEAPSLGKPVLVLRKVTERPEAVAAGAALLVGTETAAVLAAASRLLTDPDLHASMSRGRGIYGDGRAGARIVEHIRRRFGLTRIRPADFRLPPAPSDENGRAPCHISSSMNSPQRHGIVAGAQPILPA
ncbi:MAG TPA: UDP-N-acetylglucosamine 2-epimerase (non-hydrolyzing) [Elusimicrobiota bacterium]|jgi:UDP-N-acetylglucosamine 2-epimerase (non-hydrolysing)|nr:UDP-N-acetylglucosamine 2-epimerase (non-hydrolyzing) [Elusimicrobiota bacterium]